MKTEINILFVMDCLYADAGGGSERQFLEFYRNAPEYGINIHICFLEHQSIHDKLDWRIPPFTLNLGSPYSVSGLKCAKKVARYIQDNNIQLVQTLFDNAGRFSTLLQIFLDRKKQKLIIGLRNSGHNHNGLLRWELQLAYKLADHFIVNAEFIRNYIHSRYGISPEKISAIKNTFKPKALTEDKSATELQKLLKQQFKHIAVIVANLRPVKGISDLLEAIKHLNNDKIAFVFIGEGESEAEYKALCTQLEIQGQVFFLGRKDNVANYLQIADFALLTSHAEGLSNSLIEYVFAGLPVVATKVGGNGEIIEHKFNGLLAKAKSPENLAISISTLTSDIENFKSNALKAQEQAQLMYKPDTIYTTTSTLYQKLVAKEKK